MDQHGAVPLSVPAAAAAHPAAPQEGRGRCRVGAFCGFVGPVEPVHAISDRMAWHVYTAHPDLWKLLGLGGEPPVDRPAGPVA